MESKLVSNSSEITLIRKSQWGTRKIKEQEGSRVDRE
jgi:hypothetical protein